MCNPPCCKIQEIYAWLNLTFFLSGLMAYPETMSARIVVEKRFGEQLEGLLRSPRWRALESGQAGRGLYLAFVENLCAAHLCSPQILAFLYALAPPSSAAKLRENMLEEMGLDQEGIAHPSLLLDLARACGLGEEGCARVQKRARGDLSRMCMEALLLRTLKELGFAALVEVSAFEWMLSRTATTIAGFLRVSLGLNPKALLWFHHHAEVDVRHAAEALENIEDYAASYGFSKDEIGAMLDFVFRENIFIRRYLDFPSGDSSQP